MAIMFFCYIAFLLIIFIYGIISFKKLSKPFRLLIGFIGITLISEGVSRYLAIKIHNNMPVYHVLSPIEYLVYTSMYLHFLSGKIKQTILFLIIPILLFSIINTFFIQGLKVFPSNFLMLSQTLYLVYSLLGFRQMLVRPGKDSLYEQSFFWLNIAIIFFSTTLLLYYGLLNYSVRHHLHTSLLSIFSWVINFVFYLMLAVAVFTNSKRQTS
ncbi:hypothetical protein BH09BAC6_BH09BAC6_17880 [soil metagenome]|jgi:hypothetical protein